MRKIIKVLLFFTIFVVFSGADLKLFASPGDLDQSFGTNGKVSTVFPAQTTTFRPRSGISAIAIQPDGKIVAAGYAFISPDSVANAPAFALTRYNADGSLDSSFGNGGKLTTYFNGYEQVNAVAIQATRLRQREKRFRILTATGKPIFRFSVRLKESGTCSTLPAVTRPRVSG